MKKERKQLDRHFGGGNGKQDTNNKLCEWIFCILFSNCLEILATPTTQLKTTYFAWDGFISTDDTFSSLYHNWRIVGRKCIGVTFRVIE